MSAHRVVAAGVHHARALPRRPLMVLLDRVAHEGRLASDVGVMRLAAHSRIQHGRAVLGVGTGHGEHRLKRTKHKHSWVNNTRLGGAGTAIWSLGEARSQIVAGRGRCGEEAELWF